MKFGLAVTGRANPKILEKMAIKADSVGYDSFLVTDHFMLPDANNHIDVWSFFRTSPQRPRTFDSGLVLLPCHLDDLAFSRK